MSIEIIMPKLGVDMQQGEIIEWKKKEGDYVKEGDVLLEMMSDKTNMDLEAEASGYLIKIVRNNGELVPVTEVIGYLGEKDEVISTDNAPKVSEVPKEENKEEVKEVKVLKDDEFDVIVIGGGPAGYSAAIKGAQLGAKIAIVEKDNAGGTCLNRGCIPTKTYLKNTEIIHGLEQADKRGIVLKDASFKVDMEKAVQFKNQVVKTLTNGVKTLLKSNGVTIFEGFGIVNKDKTVNVNGKIIKADKILLATGSKVSKINIPGIESKLVLTSDDVLDLKEIPTNFAVIGGGVVGVELSQVFSSYGSNVTIIEMSDRIIPSMDKEVSDLLKKSLQARGIKILNSVKLQEIIEENGKLRLKIEGNEDIIADKALLSIGRVSQLEGLENLGLEIEKGRVKVNDYMETNIPGIYAPGDVNGIKMLAHSAFKMGETAIENAIKGNKRKVNLLSNPAAVYTLPEVGIVGLTEEQARAKYDVEIGKFHFIGNGRAVASGETEGFIKVIADKKYHEILGVHIIGPAAAEIINEAAALMEMEITIDEMSSAIYGHPTYSEAFFEACMDVLGESVHIPKKKK